MKRKVLPLLLLSFFIVNAYSQNAQSKEIRLNPSRSALVSSADAACTTPTDLVTDWAETNDAAVNWSVVADNYNHAIENHLIRHGLM